MDARYYDVLFYKSLRYGFSFNEVCWSAGGINPKGLKLVVLDKETMVGEWQDYNLDVHGILRGLLDKKSFEGLDVEFVKRLKTKYFLKLRGQAYSVELVDGVVFLDCPVRGKVPIFKSRLLKDAELYIAFVLDSGNAIYRVMFQILGPYITKRLNVWIDTEACLPVGTADGIADEGVAGLAGMPQDKLGELNGKLSRMALFPCCGRVF